MQIGNIQKGRAERLAEAFENRQRYQIKQGDVFILIRPTERDEDVIQCTMNIGAIHVFMPMVINVIADDVDNELTVIGTRGTSITFPMVD